MTTPDTAPVLTVQDLVVAFKRPDHAVVRAVDGISLDLRPGEILGVVGESGCGKSTVARAVMGLAPITSGSVEFRGTPVRTLGRRSRPAGLRPVQMIFQDSAAALNPRRTVGAQLAEAVRARADEPVAAREREREVAGLLDRVGLPSTAAGRYSHEFSGGQRQRIALARALASRPEVIVADEPISALDASSQAYVAELFMDVCRDASIGLLFISHDLGIVRAISDRVAVMYLGKVVEQGRTADVWNDPQHPYTRALVDAIPVADGAHILPRTLAGEVPDPAAVPSGCPFHPRCPRAIDDCAVIRPVLELKRHTEVACIRVPGGVELSSPPVVRAH
ncbi:MAG TPA: ABC transporter ATP-binding protein [Pseudolysinimonas sp.]|nr:ABC transporter ATP-binding protein [Pseudolysinimonas sp.]